MRLDGTIYRGRPEWAIGAHASGSNYNSIGICAEGNFETDKMPDAQKNSLKWLVAYIKDKYKINTVQRHRDVGSTACPGKNYPFDEIVNGKIIAGAHGAGGEIGHITVDYEETDKCGCGKCGCLEQYASATGIVRMAKKMLAATTKTTTLTKFDPLTAKDIFDEAKAGDEVAQELVETLGGVLGYAAANIACVADPEVIVIGGGVSKAGEILLTTISKHFREQCFHACSTTEFALAKLGNDAGMYGCMKMILD